MESWGTQLDRRVNVTGIEIIPGTNAYEAWRSRDRCWVQGQGGSKFLQTVNDLFPSIQGLPIPGVSSPGLSLDLPGTRKLCREHKEINLEAA